MEWRPTGGRESGGVKENGTWPRQHNGSENFFFSRCDIVKHVSASRRGNRCAFQQDQRRFTVEAFYLADEIDRPLCAFHEL